MTQIGMKSSIVKSNALFYVHLVARLGMKSISVSVIIFVYYISPTFTAEDCIKYGNTFDVPLETKNIHLNCFQSNGRKVCCEALNKTSLDHTRGVGWDYEKLSKSVKSRTDENELVKTRCEVTKEYIPSPQEIRDLKYASSIDEIEDFETRFNKLLTYVTSDEVVSNSTKWLLRIKLHMNSELSPPIINDDYEYLSRFLVTKTCRKINNNIDSPASITQWNEWIEPITITARHPFAFGRCRNTIDFYHKKQKTSRSDVDYILLQSGLSLYNQTSSITERMSRRKGSKRNHYFFDAGSSTFDSSLFWFTCGYSQVLSMFF
jgi:hypothetical protein